MLNTSSSLISEMIGTDDEASAIVYATFNILESLSVGGVAFVVMGSGMVDEKLPLKVLMTAVPLGCAVCAYLLSYWRFRKGYQTFIGEPDEVQLEHQQYHSRQYNSR